MAATDLTTRSLPSSRGLSIMSGMPAPTPGSTVKGITLKYFSVIHSSVCCTGGTTFEMATPAICVGWMPRVRSSVSKKMPYSSAVCSRRVVSRHEVTRRAPSYTPIFVFVLPTSVTSSIAHPLGHLARHRPVHRPVPLHEQGAVGVEVHRDGFHVVDGDAAAKRVGERSPLPAQRLEAVVFQPAAPRIQRAHDGV